MSNDGMPTFGQCQRTFVVGFDPAHSGEDEGFLSLVDKTTGRIKVVRFNDIIGRNASPEQIRGLIELESIL